MPWVRSPLALLFCVITGVACAASDHEGAAETEDVTSAASVVVDEASEAPLELSDTVPFDPESVDLPLDGTEWILESVLDHSVPAGSEAVLQFDQELGRVTGDTGCNAFAGEYRVTGTLLRLNSVGLTRMACAGELDQLESDVLEAFRVTGSFRIIGQALELLGDKGVVARYEGRRPGR